MHYDSISLFGKWVSGSRSKWVTLSVCVMAVLLLNVLLPTINSGEFSDTAPSEQAKKIASEEFPNTSGLPALIVWHRGGGLTDEDFERFRHVIQDVADRPLKYQESVPPI